MSAISASLILNNTKQTEELVKTLSGIEAIYHKSITKNDNMLNITLNTKTNNHMSDL
ncbi:hypothetical protein C942_02128 [Photobacterium marinum]|uniref:Uncharacterized protein n=1 Tax=Photobacterium marinum TaxID=1056511 RepID=L8JBT9_9GAMM|nr:hypothetical protein C942_02128 [Photobacterium marinum]